jgi:hypothetical protein
MYHAVIFTEQPRMLGADTRAGAFLEVLAGVPAAMAASRSDSMGSTVLLRSHRCGAREHRVSAGDAGPVIRAGLCFSILERDAPS